MINMDKQDKIKLGITIIICSLIIGLSAMEIYTYYFTFNDYETYIKPCNKDLCISYAKEHKCKLSYYSNSFKCECYFKNCFMR